jgi:hypothetical protein
VRWHIPVIPATVRSINKRIAVEASQHRKQDPMSKITKAKRAGVWLKW